MHTPVDNASAATTNQEDGNFCTFPDQGNGQDEPAKPGSHCTGRLRNGVCTRCGLRRSSWRPEMILGC